MKKVRRAGGCTPGASGFAGLWPPQNGNFPRRSRGRRDVPDRCAEGILRRGGRTAAPRQTPRHAVQHGRQGSGAVLLALFGSEMVKAANAIGLPVASEVFADRGYQADGSLVPRGAPGAMIENEDTAIAQVLQMAAQGTVQADDGSTVTLQADSVCIHGDGPKALAFV